MCMLLCWCLQASPGAAPDVADQIMQYCRQNVHCQPVLELQAQLAEQAAVLAATQQGLADKEQQLAVAQQHLAEREQGLEQTLGFNVCQGLCVGCW